VVELGGRDAVPADVVVVCIGVVPATEWLGDSGLTLDNGVVCDDRLYAAGDIVSAGDIARWAWRHDGGEVLIRIEHWQVAAEAGVAAARNVIAGRADAPSFVPIPYFWADQYGIRFEVLGNPGGDDEVEVTAGSLDEGKFVALFGRAGRLRAVMAIGKPRQLMGFGPSCSPAAAGTRRWSTPGRSDATAGIRSRASLEPPPSGMRPAALEPP